MGYSLEFYSLSWHTLRAKVAARRPEVLAGAWAQAEAGTFYEGRAERPRAVWARALDELSGALARAGPDAAEPVVLSDDAGLALVAVVRHLGRYHGAVVHASASGEAFLDGFLGGVAARLLAEPNLTELLTARPLLGLASDVFPSWGGLSASELHRMLQPDLPSPDGLEDSFRSWLEDLAALLRDAADDRSDLVTLYL